jgi:hypothetical protein
MSAERDAYSIDDFCERHRISRAYLYVLWKRGCGPRSIKLGRRRLISVDAATEWRRAMEAEGYSKTPVAYDARGSNE